MKTFPEYLAPGAVPARAGRPALLLHSLRQSTGQALRALSDVERTIEAWRKLNEDERKQAAEALGISAEELATAAANLLKARPSESRPAIVETDIRKKK